MFITERIIGVTIYCLVLIIIYQMLLWKGLRYEKVLNVYLIILSVMACFYVPYKTADLYRIFEMVEIIAQFNITELVELSVVDTSSPSAYIMYWIFGKLGLTKLLPAVVCFVTYYFIFYIIKNTARIYGISRKTIAITVLFVMATGNYIMVISNIRTMLAIAMICYCYFRESVMKKFGISHIFLYLTAILMHNFAVILFGIRIGLFFLKRKRSIFSYIFTFGVLGVLCVVVLMYGGSLVGAVVEKATGYITGDAYSYFWDYLLGTLILIEEIHILGMCKRVKGTTEVFQEYKRYVWLTILMALMFFFEFSIYYRLLTCFCPVLILPLLMVSADNMTGKKRMSYHVLLFLSLIILVLACTRGSMSSLKFFVL